MVICSLGARLRCSKKRVRFRTEPGRRLPDYFAVAVDYVAEKLRAERSKGLGVSKFITIIMDYSRLSDIPPQLEAASAFTLMRNFSSLCAHLSTNCPNKSPREQENRGVNGWKQTEAGAELWAAIGQAQDYFKAHPNWLEDRLEPPPPHLRVKRTQRRHHDQDSHSQPLLSLAPSENFCTVSSDEVNINTNASVDVLQQTCSVPKGKWCASSRPNSLPSSLSSNVLPTMPSHSQGISRSFDSFPTPDTFSLSFKDESACLACQQQEHWNVESGLKAPCPAHSHVNLDLEPSAGVLSNIEMEVGSEATTEKRCSRSKSLPSVGLAPYSQPSQISTSQTVLEGFFNSQLSESQTVLHAEVHHEWGGHVDGQVRTDLVRGKYAFQELWLQNDDDLEAPKELWNLPKTENLRSLGWKQTKENSKEWGVRNGGRVSPSSLSSDSSGSVCSGGNSVSDSLERDLQSLTSPHLFDRAIDKVFIGPSVTMIPLHSLSSSTVMSALDDHLRPMPCLTPVQLDNKPFFIPLHCEESAKSKLTLESVRVCPTKCLDSVI